MSAPAAPPWDYSALAGHYERRAPYAQATLAALTGLDVPPAGRAVDIGAGTGRFTRMLADAGFRVDAVEPNAAMRAIGAANVTHPTVTWHPTRGEHTTLPSAAYDLVGFASSFNVLDARAALDESARLLRAGGAVALLWNHRVLDDPRQAAIETLLHRMLPDFDYGTRRIDPSATITAHAAFGSVRGAELSFVHHTTTTDFVDGFRAHATLVRQAGARMPAILDALGTLLGPTSRIAVPFVTRIWVALRRP